MNKQKFQFQNSFAPQCFTRTAKHCNLYPWTNLTCMQNNIYPRWLNLVLRDATVNSVAIIHCSNQINVGSATQISCVSLLAFTDAVGAYRPPPIINTCESFFRHKAPPFAAFYSDMEGQCYISISLDSSWARDPHPLYHRLPIHYHLVLKHVTSKFLMLSFVSETCALTPSPGVSGGVQPRNQSSSRPTRM